MEKCLILLRKGGVIGIDNTLWSGSVMNPDDANDDASTSALKALNTKLAKDARVHVVLMNIGDGYTMVTKL